MNTPRNNKVWLGESSKGENSRRPPLLSHCTMACGCSWVLLSPFGGKSGRCLASLIQDREKQDIFISKPKHRIGRSGRASVVCQLIQKCSQVRTALFACVLKLP